MFKAVGLVLGREPAGLKLRPLDDDGTDCLPALPGPETNPDWPVLINLKIIRTCTCVNLDNKT